MWCTISSASDAIAWASQRPKFIAERHIRSAAASRNYTHAIPHAAGLGSRTDGSVNLLLMPPFLQPIQRVDVDRPLHAAFDGFFGGMGKVPVVGDVLGAFED